MKITTLILCHLFLFCAALPAQIDCNKFLKQGKKAARQENFELAMHSFNSARRCGDAAMGELVDREVTKLFDAINKKKDLAEEAQKEAIKEKQRAEEQTMIAQAIRDSIVVLLKKFESRAQMVGSLVKEANDSIYHLNYVHAATKIRIAATFDQPTPTFRKTVAEIAFFWNETGQTTLAIDFLEELKLNEVPREKAHLQTWLKNFAGDWYDSLMLRYYPDMVLVEGSKEGDNNLNSSIGRFKIARTETTIWQYVIYLISQGENWLTKIEPSYLGRQQSNIKGDNPVVYVSYLDACRYANWISLRFNLDSVYVIKENDDIQINFLLNGYRLPSEVEWQYAARSGRGNDLFEYAGGHEIDSLGWHGGNSGAHINPVAKKVANRLGIYDMSGNVWEWCDDWNSTHKTAIPASYKGSNWPRDHLFKGGSCFSSKEDSKITGGQYSGPEDKYNYVGFRLAL